MATALRSMMAHTLAVCFSLNPNKSTSYPLLYLSLIFFFFFFLQWDIKSLSFLSLKPGTMDFDRAQVPVRSNWVNKHSRVPATWVWVPILDKRFQAQLSEMERWWPAWYYVSSGIDRETGWRMGGKSSGKNVLRNPFHNLPENLLNTWHVLTVFNGLILGTNKIKDRRTPTRLDNSY